MTISSLDMNTVPSHVPARLVIDFDLFNPPGGERDIHLAWKALQEGPAVFWTPRNGGHWIVTRGDDITRIQCDYEIFSHSGYVVPRREVVEELIPVSLDPPRHTSYRKLVNTLFPPRLPPKEVAELKEAIRALTCDLIDKLKPLGGCEFVSAFAKQMPIVTFLKLVNLPLEDRLELLAISEKASRPRSVAENIKAQEEINVYLRPWIAKRKAQPGNDAISKVVNGKIDGEALSDSEIVAILTILMFGGLDTVASMMSFIAWHLACHREERVVLASRIGNLGQAVEEFIRRYGVANNGRLVMKDCELHGVQLRKGDQVVVPNCLHGLDETLFTRPLSVDFSRRNSFRHAAFGNGPHRCPGSYLARTELQIFVEEWLQRIPDFELAPGKQVETRCGFINAVVYLPLRWVA